MKLVQITDPAEILAIRQACFVFEAPSNIEVLMHEIRIDGRTIGYIATENFFTVGGPHIFIEEGYRNKNYLTKAAWLFKNVYFKLMKERKMEWLVTNCDSKDESTQRMMKEVGFDIQHIAVAQRKL
jgi:hypothetical protein